MYKEEDTLIFTYSIYTHDDKQNLAETKDVKGKKIRIYSVNEHNANHIDLRDVNLPVIPENNDLKNQDIVMIKLNHPEDYA